MITETQKETLDTLKNAYKKLNVKKPDSFGLLGISDIIRENELGKVLIKEIMLHNGAMNSLLEDIVRNFNNKIKDEFEALGMTTKLTWNGIGVYVKHNEFIRFSICSRGGAYKVINGEHYRKTVGHRYSVSFTRGHRGAENDVSFEDLLKSEHTKEGISRTYNYINK
tara:strand:+ start:844 stop:1344 length:501 start_codon:yes stop_codon:yes gene_type:complete